VIPNRYNLTNLFRSFRNPQLIAGEINKYLTLADGFVQKSVVKNRGIEVAEADWDVLVVLDACRYDVYEQECSLPGGVSVVQSRGSHSLEWLTENFRNHTLHDTVYVSANAYAPTLPEGVFHWVDLFSDEIDEAERAIQPTTVTRHALSASENFPNKRLIIHYMQPHVPFIGQKGKRIPHHGPDPDRDGFSVDEDIRGLWANIRYGLADIELDAAREAYCENLRIVLEEVKSLYDSIDGKMVVSSDHGNLFGERLWPFPVRGFGHPKGMRHPKLIRVPWHELPVEERRETKPDPPRAVSEPDAEAIEDRLQALGYR